MGILRNGPGGSGGEKKGAWGGGIAVQCPKCRAAVWLTSVNGHEPARCGKCRYPLILREDLLAVVKACRKLTNPNQAESAVRILRGMLEYLPEAGTALGELAGKQAIPMSEQDRWDSLAAAYARGDENAREWLDLMCRTNPDRYGQCLCGNCGAPKYVLKNSRTATPCVYCRRAEQEGRR